MIRKRIFAAFTSAMMLISMSTVLTGCDLESFFKGTKTPTPTAETPTAASSDDGVMTNGEWLAMVNDAFGMQVDETAEDGELQAAKDWGVIGEDEAVDLSAPVTDDMVTKTLVRASGFGTVDSSDQEIIRAAVDHGIISGENASVSDPGAAAAALSAAQNAWMHQDLEEHVDVALVDGVIDYTNQMSANEYTISNDSVTLTSDVAEDLKPDTVFVLPKDPETGEGGAYKTVSVIDNHDGTSTVLSVPASVEEVYKHIQLKGNFPADSRSATAEGDGVSVTVGVAEDAAHPGEVAPLGYTDDGAISPLASASADPISYTVDLGEGFTATATVKDIQLNADIDWSFNWGLKVNYMRATVDYTSEIKVESKEFKTEMTLEEALQKMHHSKPKTDIGSIEVPLGSSPLRVKLKVGLVFEASGKLSLTVTTTNTKGFELSNGNIRGINEQRSEQELYLAGEAGVYLTLDLSLNLSYMVGNVDLFSIYCEVGPKIEAEAKVHTSSDDSKDMLCVDANGYLRIKVTLSLLKDITKLFNINSTWTLLDVEKDNSPIKFHVHLENFKRTPGDVCTFEEETTEEATGAETIPVGIFALEMSYVSLDVGSASQIKIKSLPTGYTAADIQWQSSDPSKVTVDANGNISAVAAGSVGITATTKDGKYTVSCAVSAKAPIVVGGAAASLDYQSAAA